MLSQNLHVLQHPSPDSVNVQDIQQFRQLVSWLNETHIKATSSGLTDSYSASWDDNFKSYLTGLSFPFDWFQESQNQHLDSLTWLVGVAIKRQYSLRAKDLNVKSSAKMIDAVALGDNPAAAKRQKVIASSDPIENMDFHTKDFKEGVHRLATLLEVPHTHPDHLVTLEACCKIIQIRLNSKCLQNPGKVVPKGAEVFELKDHQFGVGDDVTDPVLREAMKILRLTHLNHLRDLQSAINAAIETVQAATANPKTDTRLGKVGR